jgi:UDP-galactopyranose mutase
MLHHYGPHIFNTSNKEVWDYVNSFGEFKSFTNRVKAVTEKGIFSLPINLLTINQFFGKNFRPDEAQLFLNDLGDKNISEPKSFEEQALKMLGRELYKNFFYGYTKKQWGVEPSLLPASILKRLPIRFNYDDNYYQQTYQGIPINGYTNLVENILDHDNIKVLKDVSFTNEMVNEFDHVFYSGPLDKFFNYVEGELGYRSLKFEKFNYNGDFQGNPVINYCKESVPYTRITEHKHFTPWESHKNSICFREYSILTTRNLDPYYPLRLLDDISVLQRYINIIENTSKITFIGRLGTYRYLDMHVVINESLKLAEYCLSNGIENWPKFSVKPL